MNCSDVHLGPSLVVAQVQVCVGWYIVVAQCWG
jgi:hypothetical protein